MNYRENRSEREYELVVVWKLLDDHLSVRKHKLLVRNMLKPQMRELVAAIKEVYPHLERDKYSLYCRYNGAKLYPIIDHMTLVTAYTLMDAHESFQLYMIRKDIGQWENKSPDQMTNLSDVNLLAIAGHPTRDSTEYKRGRAEHIPDKDPKLTRGSSKTRSHSAASKKSGRKSMSSRKSKTGRKSVAKRGSMKRKSTKPK